MSKLIPIIIAILLAAGFCAALEAAFFTVTLGTARVFKDKGRRGGKALLAIKESIHQTVITLVILNNAVTIVGSIYVGHIATELYGSKSIGLISALLTFVIIIFGEILPKLIGENYAKSISLFFAKPMFVLTKLFSPITFIVDVLTKGFLRENNVTSEDELKILSELGEQEGSIEKGEHDLIRRVFTLNDLKAGDIMTPRMVIEALPAGASVHEVATVLTHKPYSRYPVFEGSIDTIVGITHTRELLTALATDNGNELVSHYMTAPIFVSDKKPVDDLLALFLSSRKHMAVVEDDFGGTTGVVTFEDVLEQLVGEIVDETDEVVDLRRFAVETKRQKNR